MSTLYGTPGTGTYGALFGGGTALYGAYGSSTTTTAPLPTKYRAYEHSAAIQIEQSNARAIEKSAATNEVE